MKISVIGNIGKDAQLRTVQNGENKDSVVSVWVCENVKKRDGSVEPRWHKVTIWRKYAETMAPYLKAGRKVYVEGKASAKSYTDRNNTIVPYIDIQADEIQLMDNRRPENDVPPETEVAAEPSDEETPWG